MGVSLTKGGNVSLTKEAGAAGLTSVTVGLGWNPRTTAGQKYDLDASAVPCDASGKSPDARMVFFGDLKSADGTISHSGDNLTGEGEGDDEQIKVNLAGLSSNVEKVVFAVTIYEAAQRGQKFGDVSGCFIRIVNDADGTELARYDLQDDFALETAVIFGELYRKDSEWKFRAVGTGYNEGLEGIARDFGIAVG